MKGKELLMNFQLPSALEQGPCQRLFLLHKNFGDDLYGVRIEHFFRKKCSKIDYHI
jgi:hypothetical protein